MGSRARGSPLCYRPVGSSHSLLCLAAPRKISPDAMKTKLYFLIDYMLIDTKKQKNC